MRRKGKCFVSEPVLFAGKHVAFFYHIKTAGKANMKIQDCEMSQSNPGVLDQGHSTYFSGLVASKFMTDPF